MKTDEEKLLANVIVLEVQWNKKYSQDFFSPVARQPIVGQGLPIDEITKSHLVKHPKLGRIPPDELPAWRRDLYLTTHNIHNRQTSKLPAWFEPAIPANERPQTHALDSAATGHLYVLFTVLPTEIYCII
jgi:hypothetical protein